MSAQLTVSLAVPYTFSWAQSSQDLQRVILSVTILANRLHDEQRAQSSVSHEGSCNNLSPVGSLWYGHSGGLAPWLHVEGEYRRADIALQGSWKQVDSVCMTIIWKYVDRVWEYDNTDQEQIALSFCLFDLTRTAMEYNTVCSSHCFEISSRSFQSMEHT